LIPTKEEVVRLLRQEIATISDPVLVGRINELLVEPYCVLRAWDYGADGLEYPCWTILEHTSSNTGIAYCSEGFGPIDPWGLVFLTGSHMNIGMDSAWYSSLEGAMRDSMAWSGTNPDGYEVS
jgi:hypothetical protein